jgi:hypothetical protein
MNNEILNKITNLKKFLLSISKTELLCIVEDIFNTSENKHEYLKQFIKFQTGDYDKDYDILHKNFEFENNEVNKNLIKPYFTYFYSIKD